MTSDNDVKCPKCDHDEVREPCPLSGWYKCLAEGCGVVFDQQLRLLTGGEYRMPARETNMY